MPFLRVFLSYLKNCKHIVCKSKKRKGDTKNERRKTSLQK